MTKDYQWPPVVQPIIKERKKEKKRKEVKRKELKGKETNEHGRYLGTQSCKKQCISWPLGLHLLKLIRHSIEIKKKIKKWTINISENTGFDQSFLELTLINPHDCNNLKYDWNHAGSMSRQSESTGKARSSAMIWSQSNKRCVDNSQKNDYNHSWKWLKSSSIMIATWFQRDSNMIPTWFQHDFEWTFGAVFHKASDISGKLNPIRWSDSYVLVFSLPYVMCWLQSANWVIVITWYSDWIQRRRKQRNNKKRIKKNLVPTHFWWHPFLSKRAATSYIRLSADKMVTQDGIVLSPGNVVFVLWQNPRENLPTQKENKENPKEKIESKSSGQTPWEHESINQKENFKEKTKRERTMKANLHSSISNHVPKCQKKQNHNNTFSLVCCLHPVLFMSGQKSKLAAPLCLLSPSWVPLPLSWALKSAQRQPSLCVGDLQPALLRLGSQKGREFVNEGARWWEDAACEGWSFGSWSAHGWWDPGHLYASQ